VRGEIATPDPLSLPLRLRRRPDPVLCPKIFVPHQEFLIDHSSDVGHHARPKHFGFPLNLAPIESKILEAVFQSEKPFRGELWKAASYAISTRLSYLTIRVLCGQIFVPRWQGARPVAGAKLERNVSPITCCYCLMLWPVPWKKFLVHGSGDVSKHACPKHFGFPPNLQPRESVNCRRCFSVGEVHSR
jgi:hypothetical protein